MNRERGEKLAPRSPSSNRKRKPMDREKGDGAFLGVFAEEKDSIMAAARQAVRAYYLGEEVALSQAMATLNQAFNELDGLDYKRFAESQLLRILCIIRPGRFGASE